MDILAIIQEQVPRKQGLKHYMLATLRCISLSIQEQVPRKQGLKLFELFGSVILTCHSRASSTKTRIETDHVHDDLLIYELDIQEQVPRKQGLKLHC